MTPATMKPDNNDIDLKAGALLRRFYGYSSFREGQLEIIRNVMSRRDTLVLLSLIHISEPTRPY